MLEAVLEKRRLDQVLNAKEFAACAGVSYSMARGWFYLPGFPVFHGVVFGRTSCSGVQTTMALNRMSKKLDHSESTVVVDSNLLERSHRSKQPKDFVAS